nr:MAG TPA: YvrJ protein family protein [Caudoviricetes sp.]
MLTVKNLIKIIFLVTMTVLIQLEVIREKGHWVAGGNLAFPILLAILLWWNTLFKKRLK